ncbi:hypothetical protein [Mucilaginibacter sp.]|jgi:hypothetical protein
MMVTAGTVTLFAIIIVRLFSLIVIVVCRMQLAAFVKLRKY